MSAEGSGVPDGGSSKLRTAAKVVAALGAAWLLYAMTTSLVEHWAGDGGESTTGASTLIALAPPGSVSLVPPHPSVTSRFRAAMSAMRAEGFKADPSTPFGAALARLKGGQIAAVTVKLDNCPACKAMTDLTNGLNMEVVQELNARELTESELSFVATAPAIFLLAHSEAGAPLDPVRYTGSMEADAMDAFVQGSRAPAGGAALDVFRRLKPFMAGGTAPPAAPSSAPAAAAAAAPSAPAAAGAPSAGSVSILTDASAAVREYQSARAKPGPILFAIISTECPHSRNFLDNLQKYRGSTRVIAYVTDAGALPADSQGVVDLFASGDPRSAGPEYFPAWVVSASKDARPISGTGDESVDTIVRMATSQR